MRGVCLRLRAKGVWFSCRTVFVMEKDILARVVPSKASSMGPTSSIPHGNSMLCEDHSVWLDFQLQGSRAWLGFS